jgi:hypothetical protein
MRTLRSCASRGPSGSHHQGLQGLHQPHAPRRFAARSRGSPNQPRGVRQDASDSIQIPATFSLPDSTSGLPSIVNVLLGRYPLRSYVCTRDAALIDCSRLHVYERATGQGSAGRGGRVRALSRPAPLRYVGRKNRRRHSGHGRFLDHSGHLLSRNHSLDLDRGIRRPLAVPPSAMCAGSIGTEATPASV